jgi:hypothetical protein
VPPVFPLPVHSSSSPRRCPVLLSSRLPPPFGVSSALMMSQARARADSGRGGGGRSARDLPVHGRTPESDSPAACLPCVCVAGEGKSASGIRTRRQRECMRERGGRDERMWRLLNRAQSLFQIRVGSRRAEPRRDPCRAGRSRPGPFHMCCKNSCCCCHCCCCWCCCWFARVCRPPPSLSSSSLSAPRRRARSRPRRPWSPAGGRRT